MFEQAFIESPIGFLVVSADDKAVTNIEFEDHPPPSATRQPQALLLKKALAQLHGYFDGTRTGFDFPLRPQGTDFQLRVWDALLKIPFGTTVSYLEIARRLGDEKCIRAAASANGKNPIALVIPCHRVIGSNGQLVGYAGGLWRKKALLQHEISLVKQEGTLF